MASSKPATVSVLVEYGYQAVQDDELTLKAGDIITDVEQMDGGWWKGTLGGRSGVFPDNFVKVIEKTKAPPNGPQGNNTSNSVRPPADPNGPKPGNNPSNRPQVQSGREVKKKQRARVAYSYEPEKGDELALNVGEIVEITNQVEEGWWEGKLDGKKGLFPSNFVELISDEKGEEDFKEIKGKKVMGVGFGNIFQGNMIKLKSRQASTDADVATSPPIVTKAEARLATSKQTEAPPKAPREPPPAVKHEKARVLYSYQASHEDELDLEINDIIDILDKELEDSGWWKGSNNGRIGVFPDNFVELLTSEEKPKRPAPPLPGGKSRPQPDTEQKDDKNKSRAEPVKKGGGAPPQIGKKPNKNDPKLLSQTDDHKAQEQQIESAEPNPKLKHMTKDRARPPSNRQPPTNTTAKSPQKEIPPRPIPSPQSSRDDSSTATVSPRSPVTAAAPTTEKRGIRGSHSSDSSTPVTPINTPQPKLNGVPADVAQLQKEVHTMKEQLKQVQHSMEEMKAQFNKQLYSLMKEVDEEKKLRLSMQIEVQRIEKLIAP